MVRRWLPLSYSDGKAMAASPEKVSDGFPQQPPPERINYFMLPRDGPLVGEV